jgi:hypothetical protein
MYGRPKNRASLKNVEVSELLTRRDTEQAL